MKRVNFLLLFLLPVFLVNLAQSEDWEIVGKMPHAVYGGQVVVMDSLIYVLGGYSDSLNSPINLIQAYNPETNAWRVAGKMIENRYNFVAAVYEDSLIISCGGIHENSANIFSVEIWNNRSWAVDNARIISYNQNFNRVYFTGHIYKNRLYLFGGLPSLATTDTVILPFIINFDPSSETVDLVEDSMYQSSNIIPYHHMSVRIDSLVYIIGGVLYGVSNRVMVFNLNTHQLNLAGQLQTARAGGYAVVYDGQIYVIGGYNELSNALGSVEVYNERIDRIYNVTFLNYARHELMAAVYNDAIYVLGGKDRDNRVIPWIERYVSSETTSTTAKTIHNADVFRLYDNYPNPFNSETIINFDIDRPMDLRLEIFSISGEYIQTLARRHFVPGHYEFRWNGKDSNNNFVASGIYVYRLYNGFIYESRKMILIK